MPGWMVCLGGRVMSAEQVGLIESSSMPYLDVFRVARLYGGRVTLSNGKATIYRGGFARTIDRMSHIGQGRVAPIDAIARALGVPYAVLMEERIIRLGRNEKALRGIRIHIEAYTPVNNLPWHHMAGKEMSMRIALRVVDWLTLHQAAARLVESNDNGQDHSDGPWLTVGIRYVIDQGNGPWCAAYFQGKQGKMLATHLQRAIVLATGREGCGIRVFQTDKENLETGCIGAAYLFVGCANPGSMTGPWWHESEAATIYCGLRNFLDAST